MWSIACLTYGTAMGQHPETVIAMIGDAPPEEDRDRPPSRRRLWSHFRTARAWLGRRLSASGGPIMPDAAIVAGNAGNGR